MRNQHLSVCPVSEEGLSHILEAWRPLLSPAGLALLSCVSPVFRSPFLPPSLVHSRLPLAVQGSNKNRGERANASLM